MPTFNVYVSGRGGVYGYTADAPPAVGEQITLEAIRLVVRVSHAQPSHANGTILYLADPVEDPPDDPRFANPS